MTIIFGKKIDHILPVILADCQLSNLYSASDVLGLVKVKIDSIQVLAIVSHGVSWSSPVCHGTAFLLIDNCYEAFTKEIHRDFIIHKETAFGGLQQRVDHREPSREYDADNREWLCCECFIQ